MVVGMYPGSFDPITYGHIDIAARASQLFEKVYIAVVYTKPSKSFWFSTEQRVQLCKDALAHLPNVEVVSYTGLSVDTVKKLGAKAMIRGLRMGSDFEYEFELDLNNQKLAPDVDTVYLISKLEHIYIKSSLLREIVESDGRIDHIVPANVASALHERTNSLA
jgi:pantetheine-phosphate adenylyltransferase